MKVYLVWFIIHSIEHHILAGIYKSRKKAEKILNEKQCKISTEIFEYYITEQTIDEDELK